MQMKTLMKICFSQRGLFELEAEITSKIKSVRSLLTGEMIYYVDDAFQQNVNVDEYTDEVLFLKGHST